MGLPQRAQGVLLARQYALTFAQSDPLSSGSEPLLGRLATLVACLRAG
jgi:hypothetical protein